MASFRGGTLFLILDTFDFVPGRGCAQVLAEPIQTVMRMEGVENPYEKLKAPAPCPHASHTVTKSYAAPPQPWRCAARTAHVYRPCCCAPPRRRPRYSYIRILHTLYTLRTLYVLRIRRSFSPAAPHAQEDRSLTQPTRLKYWCRGLKVRTAAIRPNA